MEKYSAELLCRIRAKVRKYDIDKKAEKKPVTFGDREGDERRMFDGIVTRGAGLEDARWELGSYLQLVAEMPINKT